jgi:hypothetical protein
MVRQEPHAREQRLRRLHRPVTWVNRHRLHHKYADHAGDPNKLAADGFWKTLCLCNFPYKTDVNVANDAILQTWPMRLAGNTVFFVVTQAGNFVLLWWLVGSLPFATLLWVGTRLFAVWVNMVQNYWTHEKRWGYRRYEDDDNAMNIGDWLPVGRHLQRLPAEQPPSLTAVPAPEPRGLGVRLRIHDGQGHEGAWPGEGV